MAPPKPIDLSDAEAQYLDRLKSELTAICGHYEKTAPTVHAWADQLFQRVDYEAAKVLLVELYAVRQFREEGDWLQPNYAANSIYKLQHRLGQDTTGHAGF